MTVADDLRKIADIVERLSFNAMRSPAETASTIRYAADALAASQQQGPEIKGLEWSQSRVFGRIKRRGFSPFGEWTAFIVDDLTPEQIAAKEAAAQADYEARIRTALAPSVGAEEPSDDHPMLQMGEDLRGPKPRAPHKGEPVAFTLPPQLPHGTRVKVPDPTRTGEVGRVNEYSGADVHVDFSIGSWFGHAADLVLQEDYRDVLGRVVRSAWVRWAKHQPSPKASWLVPYDNLSEPDKEADRQIGEALSRYATPPQAPIPEGMVLARQVKAMFDAARADGLWIGAGMSAAHARTDDAQYGPHAKRVLATLEAMLAATPAPQAEPGAGE